MSSYVPRSAEYPPLAIEAAGDKDIGGRDHDEDSFLVRPDIPLFAVADGAGGENAGNVASSLALSALARSYEESARRLRDAPIFDVLGLPVQARRLSTAIQRANAEVLEVARSGDRYRGMGTTLVVAAPDLGHGVIHIGHVGDSRCYRLRAGRLELMTQDHSLAQDVLELKPEADEETLAGLPHNVITRALGMSARVRVSVRTLDLALGDRFVLCSDGLTDVLGDEAIADVLITAGRARVGAGALVAAAREAIADDNVAVVVVDIDAAAGVTSVPKRHMTRPRPAAIDADASADSNDDPEIIIMDSEPPVATAHSFHVIPKAAAYANLSALSALVVPRAAASSAPPSSIGLDEADQLIPLEPMLPTSDDLEEEVETLVDDDEVEDLGESS